MLAAFKDGNVDLFIASIVVYDFLREATLDAAIQLAILYSRYIHVSENEAAAQRHLVINVLKALLNPDW